MSKAEDLCETLEDIASLEAEITKLETIANINFEDRSSGLFILSSWRKITNNKNTEKVIEDKYIEAWNRWALEQGKIQTARVASNLSKLLLFAIGPTKFSEALMGIASNTAEICLGLDNAETAQYINDHGFFLDQLEDKKTARNLYKKAFAIRSRILDQDDPAIAESLNNIATTEPDKRALAKLLQALNIRRKSLGSHHPDTLNSIRNVASTLDLIGRHDEAEILLNESVDICENIHGSDSEELADSLTYLSVFLWHNDKASRSIQVGERALSIKENIFGQHNPELIHNLMSLSNAYMIEDCPDQGVSALRRAFDIAYSFYGPDDNLTEEIRDRLVVIDDDEDGITESPVNIRDKHKLQ